MARKSARKSRAVSERKELPASQRGEFKDDGERANRAARQAMTHLFHEVLAAEVASDLISLPTSFGVVFGTVGSSTSVRTRGGGQIVEDGEVYTTKGGKFMLPWRTNSWADAAAYGLPLLIAKCVLAEKKKATKKDPTEIDHQGDAMRHFGYEPPLRTDGSGKPAGLSARSWSLERSRKAIRLAEKIGKEMEAKFGPWPDRAAILSNRSASGRQRLGRRNHVVVKCTVKGCTYGARHGARQWNAIVLEVYEGVCGHEGKLRATEVVGESEVQPDEPIPLSEVTARMEAAKEAEKAA